MTKEVIHGHNSSTSAPLFLFSFFFCVFLWYLLQWDGSLTFETWLFIEKKSRGAEKFTQANL